LEIAIGASDPRYIWCGPDGTDRHRLTPRAVGRVEAADWSPSGKRLVLSVVNSLGNKDLSRASADIAVVRRNGSSFRRITRDHPGVDTDPDW